LTAREMAFEKDRSGRDREGGNDNPDASSLRDRRKVGGTQIRPRNGMAGEPGPQQHDRCVAKKECGQSHRCEYNEASHGLRDHRVPGGVLAISVLTRWADKIA
jgi:hypothetical protein